MHFGGCLVHFSMYMYMYIVAGTTGSVQIRVSLFQKSSIERFHCIQSPIHTF